MFKKILTSLIIGVLSFGLFWLISTKSLLLEGMERNLVNFYYYIREPGILRENPYASSKTALIGYDIESIAAIGKWPWKRNVHGEFLRNLQKYSPQTVMFDVLFINPDKIPSFIEDEYASTPSAQKRLRDTFKKMDDVFAEALSEQDNVYIDLMLVEKQRELSEAYLNRIRYTESKLGDYSQPSDPDSFSPLPFYSLEPLVENYIDNAHPVVVNIRSDDDSLVRRFPLYFTYQYLDGSTRNIFTVALVLLKNYYRVSSDFINIQKDKVIINFAKVPRLDLETKEEKIEIKNFSTINKKIINPKPKKGYAYNKNLYSFLVNDLLSRNPDTASPYYPIHLLLTKDGKFQILDAWEVYDACIKTKSKNISFVIYDEKDIVIKTDPLYYNSMNINYAGREAIIYRPEGENRIKNYNHINTYSYKDTYFDTDVPELPIINQTKNLSPDEIKKIETWFYQYVSKKAAEVKLDMQNRLGESIGDANARDDYYNTTPWKAKYIFYEMFLEVAMEQLGVKVGEFHKVFNVYPDFLSQMELSQDSEYHLTITAMLEALNQHYGDQFDNFYNKLVFSGAYTGGIGDVKQTPYGAMFGINVIINAINTIITENQMFFLRDIPGFNIGLLLLVCLLGGLTYGLLNVRVASYLFVFVLFSLFLLPVVLFHYNYVLDILPTVFGNIIVFVSLVIFKLLTEEKDKRFLKATFASYLSPEVIDDMYDSKQMPQLGGEALHITAYFTDIEGFSTFSEKLTASQLVELLNEYLSAMTDILLAEQGTLDKYEGDAIIAFIGAPKSLPDHAFRSCRIAIKMQNKLFELREKWKNDFIRQDEENRNIKNLPEEEWVKNAKWPKIVWDMKMRIGINTGDMVIGNMGSDTRMNYTMMGDSVNLAARLEEGAKQYGVYTFASEMSLNQSWTTQQGETFVCKELLDYRMIDRIIVIGKSEPVCVFEVISEKGRSSLQEQELLKKWDEAMKLYLAMKWDEAKAMFEQTQEIERFPHNDLNPSKVMIKRCVDFKNNPNELNVDENGKWDGVYSLTSK